MNAPRDFLLPDLGEGLTEAELISWSVAVGDHVEVDQPLCEVETAKAVVEIPAPFSGTVAAQHAAPGEVVPVGRPLVAIDEDGDSTPTPASASADSAPPNLAGSGPLPHRPARPGWRRRSQGNTRERRSALPAARKAARALGVPLDSVPASRPDGVVTAADVQAYAADSAAGGSRSHRDGDETASAGPTTSETRVPTTGVRRATAEAVAGSARTIPHATAFRTVDVTASIELLDRLHDAADYRDVHLTPLTVVANAALVALRRHPVFNSAWDEDTGEIIEHSAVNLGVAVAGPRGLTVPNLRSADDLGLRGLAGALTELVEDARGARSTVADLTGGTFTITNVGVFGLDAGTAIINPGESAILCLGSVARRPWVVDDQLTVRSVATLGLSFDHRLIDGEQAGLFLGAMAEVLENPLRLAE